MRILIFDACCPKPYDSHTLDTEALGGTEATVVRVAEGLAKRGHYVVVQQHCREGFTTSGELGPEYAPLSFEPVGIDAVLSLRDLKTLPYLKDKYPKAKLFLWAHDLPTNELCQNVPLLDDIGAQVVCVSKWHRTQVVETLISGGYDGTHFRVSHIYNPIDDSLMIDAAIKTNLNKLVFFSSPHKGLEDALLHFSNLLRFNEEFKLYVANPGYYPSLAKEVPGVVNLGAISHSEAIAHVRTSLAVLYPNRVFPETFGLVFAEGNAVGTPVLTHDIGAANEVLDAPQYEIVGQSTKEVVDTIMKWRNGERPTVRGRKDFRATAIVKEWEALLGK